VIDVARSIPSEVIGNKILGCQSMIFVRQSVAPGGNASRDALLDTAAEIAELLTTEGGFKNYRL